MSDPLAQLTLCEDEAVRETLSPNTVVFKDVWASSGYVQRILPIAERLSIKSKSVGLADDGIAVTYASRRDAILMRLFFDGEATVH